MAEYGLAESDLLDLPCTWRTCHGNRYPLFERSVVEAVVRGKKESDPAYAAAAQTKADVQALCAAKSTLRGKAVQVDISSTAR